MRFRKSIKLAPGIRMNFSRSGASWTLGPRGASVGIGKRGTYLNTGIPGTGLYSRTKIGGTAASTRTASQKTRIAVNVGVADDGTLIFQDAAGNALSEHLTNAAKKQQRAAIQDLIQKKCDEINAQIEAVGEIHLYTPNPTSSPKYEPRQFQQSAPVKPVLKRPNFFCWLFKKRRERLEQENAATQTQYETATAKWLEDKFLFDQAEEQRKELIERLIYTDVDAMQLFLEQNLNTIVWPRETFLSTDIRNGGTTVFVDVDLPEIEDMPQKTAAVPAHGLKLSVKDMTGTQIQRLYMRHVHGIGFRIIGETFAALPNAERIVLSGYSQRANPSTGHISDEYLYSVRISRHEWSQINFDNLQALDVVEVLTQFELRRNMSKTGRFKPIEPFETD